ncbi:hypothetical protein EW146_g5046 [Bondarzewia mesenterica]|uniref:Uncharacterized protein n=1 Tax=Bondarzewia mesenterica TaxID=1095465 RepID=A0A4S4LYE3_9AGAM|nr:hypothetical protein EW146_g5046 [Bondarzewia mesenterica]
MADGGAPALLRGSASFGFSTSPPVAPALAAAASTVFSDSTACPFSWVFSPRSTSAEGLGENPPKMLVRRFG